MLDWITGLPRSYGAHEVALDSSPSFIEEPPETPAHLFAVKAFKQALFGTPAPARVDNVNKSQAQNITHQVTNKGSRCGENSVPEILMVHGPEPAAVEESTVKPLRSPAKGILLTPGTAAARRKTVTFGKLSDNLQNLVDSTASIVEGTTKELDLPGTKVQTSYKKGHRRELSLRRNLFEIRGKPTEVKVTAQEALQITEIESKALQKEQGCEQKETGDNNEITTDLKHPLSRSGQHWKREYHRDHETSKREMRKLIRYTQVAKSYAVKRDAEALELGEKLKHAQLRVAEMEGRVSALAAQLVKDGGTNKGPLLDQVNMLNELAAQTAQALRYKQKAEKYRLAIEERSSAPRAVAEERNGISRQKSKDVVGDPLLSQESQQAQPQDIALLQEEIAILQSVSKAAESKAALLERENLSLKHSLARVKQAMKGYEVRHLAREERRKRKDEKAEAQIQMLKKELAHHKLGHQQVSSREAVSIVDGQMLGAPEKARTLKPHAVVENLNLQYRQREPAQVSEQGHLSHESFSNAPTSKDHNIIKKLDAHPKPDTLDQIPSSSLHESFDIWTTAVPGDRNSKINKADMKAEPLDHSLQNKVESQLAEVHHEVRGPLSDFIIEGPIGQLNIVPAEKKAGDRAHSDAKETAHNVSTTPNIASSALQLGNHPLHSRSNTLGRVPSSSRASSLRERPPLPPDRIEAAKRRLERRNAAKSKGAIDEKENRTP